MNLDLDSEPRIIQTIEIKGLAASCDEPVVATLLPTRTGNRILIRITELEGPKS